MKLGSRSQERIQMLRKPGNAPNFHPGFNIYPVDLSEIAVFLKYFSWIFPKIHPWAFLAYPEAN